MTYYQRLGVFILLLACLMAPRLALVGRTVTVDEARWLLRSGNFYQALASGNLADTYQHEQPGVTVTWAGALAYLGRFPAFARLAGGQLPGPSSLENLFKDHSQSPLRVLAAGRILVVLALGLILSLAGWYTARLLGWRAAFLGLGLIALDPFSLSLTYLLQPDGLSSSLMLVSVLASLSYCLAGRRRLDLLLSGIAGGLAVLSKSPAGFLLPFLGLVGLVCLPGSGQSPWSPARWKNGLSVILIWAAIAAVTFVAFWPAMWVDPLGTLQAMFGGALQYAVEGNLNSVYFNGQIYPSGQSAWYFYLAVLVWRATPILLAGLALAAWRGFSGGRRAKRDGEKGGMQKNDRPVAGMLLLYAGLYLLVISLAGQKHDRYLLPAWLALLLLAGWGWDGLLEWLLPKIRLRFGGSYQTAAGLILAAVLLAGQGLGATRVYPYYYSYYNPLLGGLPAAARVFMVGWGEGLDQAGRELNTQPNATGLRVLSWYGDGCFSYFFDGRTVNMDKTTTLADLKRMDYVVTYYQQWQRQEPNPEVLAYLDGLTPLEVIRVGGLDLVRIYQIRGE